MKIITRKIEFHKEVLIVEKISKFVSRMTMEFLRHWSQKYTVIPRYSRPSLLRYINWSEKPTLPRWDGEISLWLEWIKQAYIYSIVRKLMSLIWLLPISLKWYILKIDLLVSNFLPNFTLLSKNILSFSPLVHNQPKALKCPYHWYYTNRLFVFGYRLNWKIWEIC